MSFHNKHFQDRNELENAVTVYINSKEGTNFYANSIRKLPERWNYIYEHEGAYYPD
jgi:hypothetical protein